MRRWLSYKIFVFCVIAAKTRDREKETDGQTDGRALVQVKRGRCGRDRHNESNIISSF